MANAIILLKVMPTGGTDLTSLFEKVSSAITTQGGDVKAHKEEPMAFGIKVLMITFIIDENKGTEETEKAVAAVEGVSSVQIASYDRVG